MESPVDVFVMTRNSGRFLEGCLRCVKRGVNMNRLIIIDGGSTDDTLDIALSYGAEIYDDGGQGLGFARRLSIDICETEWLCFVDADVELPPKWHERVMRYASPDIGAIASRTETVPINEYEMRITRIQNHRARARARVSDLRGKSVRGFTGATMIRSSLLRDIQMPKIYSEEDYVITQHILKYARWIRVPIFVRHWDRFSERPDRIEHTWATARALRRMETQKFIKQQVFAIARSLPLAIFYREPLFFVHYIKYAFHALRGWLHSERYIQQSYPTGRVRSLAPSKNLNESPSLNVGCGATNQYPFKDFGCDVNVDISFPEMKVPNYICCDAYHLPFRPVFRKLIASHLVEHLSDPETAIENFKAISKFVTFVVPHWLSTDAYLDPTHRWVRFRKIWYSTPRLLHSFVQHRRFRRMLNRFHRLLRLPRQACIEIYKQN